ncbi:MAG: flagellar hook-basal body complex protein FliE [Lachnospiraceae bacterium]|nr:flagellar hook-basal body complex protein FliE [Lachnospiraceae bacterium]
MDIASLSRINPVSLGEALSRNPANQALDENAFGGLLATAMNHLNATNSYINESQNAEIRWALGETSSTHELTNAMQKSSIALQYTVAIRDKILEAYKEIMQMQI